MQGDRTVGRHIVRKFLANVLLVIAVAWLVAGKSLVIPRSQTMLREVMTHGNQTTPHTILHTFVMAKIFSKVICPYFG